MILNLSRLTLRFVFSLHVDGESDCRANSQLVVSRSSLKLPPACAIPPLTTYPVCVRVCVCRVVAVMMIIIKSPLAQIQIYGYTAQQAV